jgi:hypothetical protein
MDLIAGTRHDTHIRADYAQLRGHGLATVRDGLRWHLVEAADGQFDLGSITAAFAAQAATKTQVIWDLMHFGLPDFIDPFEPSFPWRFARFAKVVGRHFREICGDAPFWCPINEMSFHSWIAGEVGEFAPFAEGRGFELKRQLAAAAISATRALRAVDPRARFLACEPLISVSHDPADPADPLGAELFNEAQFQACDMLAGHLAPELGGSPDCLDIVGLNYYPNNQWLHGEGRKIGPGDAQFRPLDRLITAAFARYGRPVVLSETGTEGDGRADWLDYVHDAVMTARARGVPVEGLCLYPIVDHLGWDGERLCPNGLLSDTVGPDGRSVHHPLAERLAEHVARFDAETSPESLPFRRTSR